MPSMKISLLALASTAAAVPHYGANPHSKFHSLKPSGTAGYGHGHVGTGKPYPTGGWSGGYNSTAIPYPAGTGAYDDEKTTTLAKTSTSTETVYSTVVIKPSASGNYEPSGVAAENVPTGAGQCGPATVTVTASEKVTVTVTPGGGAYVPKSSAAPVQSKYDNGYGASSPVAEKPTSSVAGYPAETPKVEEASSTPAAVYPIKTPSVEKATPSQAEYVAPSYAQSQPVAYSSVVASPSASPSAPASSGNTYSGTKRGLAYNEAELCSSLGSKFGFGYNWGQVENNDIGTNFIPMMHGPSQSTAEDWLANVDKAKSQGSSAVMGFNECDIATQCNLSPEAACASWKTYMNPVKSSYPDMTIIGPSVSNSGSPNQGLDWLSQFHDNCPDAVVDATNIHFYDIYQEGQTLDRFKAQVEKAADLYGKPVWVTEFGLNPGSASSDQAVTFLKGCMEYLDNSDKVQGYSWFMVGTGENQLNTANGLSAVGQAYASS